MFKLAPINFARSLPILGKNSQTTKTDPPVGMIRSKVCSGLIRRSRMIVESEVGPTIPKIVLIIGRLLLANFCFLIPFNSLVGSPSHVPTESNLPEGAFAAISELQSAKCVFTCFFVSSVGYVHHV